MCGLFGISSHSLTDKERRVFIELMVGSVLRGNHSTGVGYYRKTYNDKSVHYLKHSVNAVTFSKLKDFKEIIRDTNVVSLMGHTRAATDKQVNNKNAHPWFKRGNHGVICGMHNGTVKKMSSPRKIDSENIISYLAKNGVEKTIKELNNDGSYALSWYNSTDKTLNFIRNDTRSLHFTTLANRQTLVWASEAGLLEYILERNACDYSDIKALRPFHHLRFKYDDYFIMKSMDIKYVPPEKPEAPEFKPGFSYWGASGTSKIQTHCACCNSRYVHLDKIWNLSEDVSICHECSEIEDVELLVAS